MRRNPADASGMIRALEDFLAATRPPEPPAPPRQKSEAESKLEKLLEELSRPQPPVPQPVPEPEAEVQEEFPPIEAPSPVEQPAPVAKALAVEPPQPATRPEPHGWPWRTVLALSVAAAGLAPLFMKRAPSPAQRTLPAPAAAPARVEPLPSDPRSRALALVLAYRPSGGPITSGEIFRSIAGDPIPEESWEITPAGQDRFLVRFMPYRGTLGENSSYEFEVDSRAGRVKPRSGTNERLRVDALGRLAARSDLQAFWQFLDLRR